MPETAERPAPQEELNNSSTDQDINDDLTLKEWEQRIAAVERQPESAEVLIRQGQELYADIRMRASAATRKGEAANYRKLEVAKLPLRDRRSREQLIDRDLVAANEVVRSADEERKFVHNQLARLYIVAGRSPKASEITIDQFLEAAGKDFRAASMASLKSLLKKPGDTAIESIVDELESFEPLLADLDLDEIAVNLARHRVEKDLGFVA